LPRLIASAKGQKISAKLLPVAMKHLISPAVGVSNTVMDPTKIRMRYLLAILLAAIITAAALRHFLHVNAGFSRLEILEGALACVALAVFLSLAWRRLRRD
jgi:hypothetical protein